MAILRKGWFAAILCAFLAVAAYLPALRAGFVWDDSIVQSLQIPYFSSWRDAFHPPPNLVEWSTAYYRPVVALTYLAEKNLNASLYGDPRTQGNWEAPERARIPHAVTLLIHALATLCVVLLARRCLAGLSGQAWGTWAAGLIFALHPVHSETAASIAGRSDSLATLFLTAGIVLALRGRDKTGLPAYLGAALLFFGALLSKEVAIAGLALLPLCLAWVPKERKPENEERPGREPSRWEQPWVCMTLFVVAAGVYMALRTEAGIGFRGGRPLDWGAAVFDLPRGMSFYLLKMFAPWPLSPYIPELPGWIETAAALAAGTGLAAWAVWLYRRGTKLYLLCLLWFAAACAPSLFLVVRHAAETVVAERYVYLPSVAFALAAGGAAAHLTQGRFKKPLFAVLGGLLAVYAVTSWRATALWQDDLSLWSGLVRQTVPARHALPWVNLGVSQMAAKNLDEAERAFLHAQDPGVISDVENQALVASGLGSVAVSRGMAAFASGRQDEALRLFTHAEYYFTQAVSSGLPDWTFAKNLGQTRIYRAIVDRVRTGRYDRGLLLSARQDLLLALRLSPGNAEIQSLLDSCESYLSSSP